MSRIQDIRRCGTGVEVIINDVAYFVDTTNISTLAEFKAALLASYQATNPSFDGAKLSSLKNFIGQDVVGI